MYFGRKTMQKTELLRRYNMSRINIIIVCILSAINIITITYNDSFFLLSLSFPRFVQMIIQFYIDEGLLSRSDLNFVLVAAFMAIPIILFLLSYFFTKNGKYKGFIWAIVILALDSVFTIITYDIIDIIFHIYIFVLLGLGISYGKKINNGSFKEDLVSQVVFEEDQFGNRVAQDTNALRNDISKGRILIQTKYNYLNIKVKRYKGITSLIINDKVYDEIKVAIERFYSLYAVVDNIQIEFRLVNTQMEIYVNGERIMKKIRWY